MHILFTCIYRVRLVERGSPHSLPLMESGKVSTERTFILTFYGEYFQYISISDNFYISWVLKEALSAVQTEATEALAAHTLPVMLRMLISSVLTAALPTLVGRGRSFCQLTSAHLCLVVCPLHEVTGRPLSWGGCSVPLPFLWYRPKFHGVHAFVLWVLLIF